MDDLCLSSWYNHLSLYVYTHKLKNLSTLVLRLLQTINVKVDFHISYNS